MMKRGRKEQEVIYSLVLFIKKLNDESSNGALVVVEGIRDVNALNSLGYIGPIYMLCQKDLLHLISETKKYKKTILLLDLDREGKRLTKKVILMLHENKLVVDLFFRRELTPITKGRVKHIEELDRYKDLRSYAVGPNTNEGFDI